MWFPTLLTWHPAGRLSVFQFKTRETRPKPKSIQYPAIFSRFQPFFQIQPLFSRFQHLFSRFRPLFHLNPLIFGIINTESSQTSDFSSRFGKNPIGSDGISPDLGWIWQDLAGFGEISPHLEGFRWDQFHPKSTTTRWRPEPTNPLLLRVGYELGKNPTLPTHGQP